MIKDKRFYIDLISKHCYGTFNTMLLITTEDLDKLAEKLAGQVEPVVIVKPTDNIKANINENKRWRDEFLSMNLDSKFTAHNISLIMSERIRELEKELSRLSE